MKKEYSNPIIELILLNKEDILQSSLENVFCRSLAGDTETDYNLLG